MDSAEERAQRLCVEVGTLMEDASADAVSTAVDIDDLRRRIGALRSTVAQCRLLLEEAALLVRAG